jgi:hypothetical protein
MNGGKGIEIDNKMNHYIEYLFSKDTCHQLIILKALFSSSSGLDIEALTKIINVDRRTIYSHLNYIKELCKKHEDSGSIDVSKKWEYYFSGNIVEYHNLRSYLLENEYILKLSELFLENSSVNFSDFCQENFIGESTLKRKISKANILLRTTDIRIIFRKNCLYIEGEERKIRYCLISLLWRSYRGTRWPFRQIEEEAIDSILSTVLSDGRKISYGKQKQLSLYLAVFISRAKTNHIILEENLPSYSKQLIQNNKYLPKLSNIVKKFFDIPDEEIAFILLTFYTFPECYDYFQKTDDTLDVLKKYSKKSYYSVIKFVNFIEKKHPEWDRNGPSSSFFWSMLVSGRIFVDIFGDLYFNSSDVRIFSQAKTEYPNLMPTIEKRILLVESDLSKNTLKSLTLRYAQAYISEFSPQDFEPEIRILLLSDAALYIDLITQERIGNLLRDKYNFILEFDFSTKKPDLVLATGRIDTEDKSSKVVYISYGITIKDAKNILTACQEILELKNKKQ